MGIIGHIAVLIFAVIVVVIVGILLVIETFGTVDYLTDKAPWLRKILERRSAPGVLILVVILLLAGNGYELLIKELPDVPVLPKMPAPRAPEILPCKIQVVSQTAPKTASQENPSEKPCPPPQTITKTIGQVNPEQIQLEKLIEANRTLPKGDRDRLAEAFFSFAQIQDQANALWGKANRGGAQLRQARSNGTFLKDFDKLKKDFRDIESSAKDYEKAFSQEREKWKYYQPQISYIFGDNPDNNALIIRNAIDEYSSFLDDWGRIQNKEDQKIQELFLFEEPRFQDTINRFLFWKRDCDRRLGEMKSSIQ